MGFYSLNKQSYLILYLYTTFIKRIIHNLICSDALCMRNNGHAIHTLCNCFVNACDPYVLFW